MEIIFKMTIWIVPTASWTSSFCCVNYSPGWKGWRLKQLQRTQRPAKPVGSAPRDAGLRQEGALAVQALAGCSHTSNPHLCLWSPWDGLMEGRLCSADATSQSLVCCCFNMNFLGFKRAFLFLHLLLKSSMKTSLFHLKEMVCVNKGVWILFFTISCTMPRVIIWKGNR